MSTSLALRSLPRARVVTRAPALGAFYYVAHRAPRTDRPLQPDSPRAAPRMHTPLAVVRSPGLLSVQQALNRRSHHSGHRERPDIVPRAVTHARLAPLGIRAPALRRARPAHRRGIRDLG